MQPVIAIRKKLQKILDGRQNMELQKCVKIHGDGRAGIPMAMEMQYRCSDDSGRSEIRKGIEEK